jgi:hypothetical protein
MAFGFFGEAAAFPAGFFHPLDAGIPAGKSTEPRSIRMCRSVEATQERYFLRSQ